LDFTNNYGVRPFLPFNPRWYSWDIVYVVEPTILAALVLALVMPALLGLADREMGVRRTKFRGRGWAIAALVSMALTYALRNAEHTHALELVRNSGPVSAPVTRIGIEPYPINPFKWFAIAETSNRWQTAIVNTRTDNIDTDAGSTIFKPPPTPATAAARQSWLGRTYIDWAVPGRDQPRSGGQPGAALWPRNRSGRANVDGSALSRPPFRLFPCLFRRL